MIMYFQLLVDKAVNYGFARPDNLEPEVSFISGAMISVPVPSPLRFTTDASASDELPAFWDDGVPVMSSKFLALLEGAGVGNLQVFPAIIESKTDATVWGDYFAVNILGLIKTADFDKSVYTEILPGCFDFDVLAIDAKLTNDALLFRMQESASTIIVHKSVMKFVMDNDPDEFLTGWDIDEIVQ